MHKSNISAIEGGGGRYKKVSVKGASINKPRPTKNMKGMDTLSMVVSMVGRTCSRVANPLVS